MSVSETASLENTCSDRAALRLVVSLPALNEERTVGQVIESIPRDIPGVGSVAVLVVNDGSTDRTAEVAREAGAHVLHHENPRGVGAAFHTALNYSMEQSADLLVTIDADGQFDPAHIPKLIEPVVSGKADFSTASRFIDPALTPKMPWIKRWGNARMSRLISRLTRQRFYDVSCGMRCYSRRAMLNLNLMGAFTYTQEVFLNLAFKKMSLAEIPIPVRGVREHGKSRVASNLWRYGFNTLRIIFSAYRDYRPMQFFGGLALLLAIPAVLLGGFQLGWYFYSEAFSPYKWTGFTSVALTGLSVILLHIGIIGDMLNRHRTYLEEILVHTRTHGGGHEPPRSENSEA